ncbi:MAG: sigma-E factor negative regulatory protein [Gammaproteobacteria bacterium]
MDKHQSEQLSAISDGEAVYDDVMSRQIATSTDLQEQWNHTHLIRDVLRGHKVSREALCLSQRVSAALQEEPTILAPQKRFGTTTFMKQAGGFAIAATIAVVAVLTVQQAPTTPGEQPMSIASVPQLTTQPLSTNIRTVSSQRELPRVSSEVERKLNSYIVTHNEHSASSNMQGLLPYVRIVGVVPARQVDNEK